MKPIRRMRRASTSQTPPPRHVGPVEDTAVRRELDVLRHRPRAQRDRAQHARVRQVDDDHAPRELARHERPPPVRREVHVVDARAAGHVQGRPQAHCVRLAEVQLAVGLGDDDRAPAVGL
jgi:hypothetical protein